MKSEESITLTRAEYNDALAAAVRDGAAFAQDEEVLSAALHASAASCFYIPEGWNTCYRADEHRHQAKLMRDWLEKASNSV